jgi:hypothetical protein
MAEIYGITSTRDGVIRYVGQTKGESDKRYRDHWVGLTSNHRVAIWKRQELWSGYDIDWVVIEECDDCDRHKRESFWIKRIPNLLNDRKNYGSSGERVTLGELNHIEFVQNEYRPNYEENWQGFAGIRYFPPETKYPFPVWETKVYDVFGEPWIPRIPVASFEAALSYREEARNKANDEHLRLLGVRMPWPSDKVLITNKDIHSPN